MPCGGVWTAVEARFLLTIFNFANFVACLGHLLCCALRAFLRSTWCGVCPGGCDYVGVVTHTYI